MPEFTVNPGRHDPYAPYAFQVMWDGRVVAGISEISPLIRRTDVIVHRSGGDVGPSRRAPGLTTFDPIVLSRGVTHDTDFEDWANKVFVYGAALGGEVSLADFRKDITIRLLNEAGQVVIAYNVFRCWVSEYEALPQLDAGSTGIVAIQSLTLQNEGWVRDIAVTEPVQPTINAAT
jgi:phage tail-like protein